MDLAQSESARCLSHLFPKVLNKGYFCFSTTGGMTTMIPHIGYGIDVSVRAEDLLDPCNLLVAEIT